MRVGKITLQASEYLKPLRQGDGSCLCGLYSVLNAYQLAGWPETKFTRKKLTSLISFAANTIDTPVSAILGRGMSEETWVKLCAGLIDEANELFGRTINRKLILQGKAGRSTVTSLRAIKRHIDQGRPVLVMLWGNYDHATVISGYTSDRFLLFDSSGLKWIAAENVGIDHSWSSKAHRISRYSAFALMDCEK